MLELLDKSRCVKFVNPASSSVYSDEGIPTYANASRFKFGVLKTYLRVW